MAKSSAGNLLPVDGRSSPMKPTSTGVMDAYCSEQEAAEYVRISPSKLAKLRMRSNREQGPRFAKIGGRVVYRRQDLDDWIEAAMVGSGQSPPR